MSDILDVLFILIGLWMYRLIERGSRLWRGAIVISIIIGISSIVVFMSLISNHAEPYRIEFLQKYLALWFFLTATLTVICVAAIGYILNKKD